jgi:tRNA pseudouridine65 synthase
MTGSNQLQDEPLDSAPPNQHAIPVLYADEAVLIVHKPAGIHVHPSQLSPGEESCLGLLQRTHSGPLYPAHRLDRATAGVLVFTRSAVWAAAAGKDLAQGRWSKTYQLVVRGWPAPCGTYTDPLPSRDGKKHVTAETAFERLQTFLVPVQVDRYPQERYALMRAKPITGRMHQLRQHFRKASHPLIGDVKYGHGRHNAHFRTAAQAEGLLLWASEIEIPHPESGATLKVAAAKHCPLHFRNALNYLEPFRIGDTETEENQTHGTEKQESSAKRPHH